MSIDLLPDLNNISVNMKLNKFTSVLEEITNNNIEQLLYELQVCKQGIDQINSLIPNLNFKLNTNDKILAFNKLNNLLNRNVDINIGDCQQFIDSLGTTNFLNIFGFDIQRILKLPNVDFKKYPIILSSLMTSTINDITSTILDPVEKEISDLILSVETNISIQVVNLLLNIQPSLKHCQPIQNLDVEKIMNQYGMLINRNIDYTQLEFNFIQSKHFEDINLSRKNINITINRKLNKIF